VRDRDRPGGFGIYTYRGRPLHYRTASSDMTIIHDVLLYPGYKSEYWTPAEIDPRVILDLGANIGVAAVYYANLFPRAVVHSFEPVPANYELLVKNTKSYDNIRCYNAAVGRSDGRLEIQSSANTANYGGASLYGVESDPANKVAVEVWSSATMLERAGIDHADLIKIDTEGAEYDILTSLDREVLFRAKWIIGELHGVNDFKLLAYLAEGFLIDVRKTLHKRFFRFNACHPSIIDRIPKHLVKWLQY
jgi:FkbM family methyltransferase